MAQHIPRKGDLIAVSFDPQSGHEQKGRRLVVSNYLFTRHTGLAIVCPITKTDRKIPFHLPLPESSSLAGFVMAEQIKSIDYAARKAKFIESAPNQLVQDVLGILDACLR